MSSASFDYDEENVVGASKLWDMGTSANSLAFGRDSVSYEYIAHKNQNVHLLQKIKPVSVGPKIPATLSERLSFFRVYFNSYGKTFGNLDPFDFNRLIWDYFINVVFKLIPTSYIYYFLGTYVPDEHLYIPKMVPIFAGYNLLLVIAATILLTFQGCYVNMLFYYAFAGLVFQSPWKSCNEEHMRRLSDNLTCIDIPSLLRLEADSVNVKRHDAVYWATFKDNVTTAYLPSLYLQHTYVSKKIFSDNQWPYCVTLFIVASLFYKQLYKEYIWKVLRNFQWVTQVIYFGCVVHLLVIELETKYRGHEEFLTHRNRSLPHPDIQDSSIIQDMVHAPPLINFISSRTTEQINPASDTAMLVLSNTLFFFLKLMTHHKIIRYCEHISGLCLREYSDKRIFEFFFWPLYLSMVPFGDIIVIIIYIVCFVTEFLTFVISYQTLIEILTIKWTRVSKCIALIVTLVILAAAPHFVMYFGTAMQFITTILWSSAFLEVSIIVFIYPVSRLLDDIMFHFGSPPSQLTDFFIRSIPFTYFMLFYIYYSNFIENCQHRDSCTNDHKGLKEGLMTVAVVMIAGAIYICIKVKKENSEGWRALIRPVPDWGPHDHTQRQLRKYFDSREYTRSRASRYLSRYLMTRALERYYQLDLLYERQSARSTLLQDSIRFRNEKGKEKVD